MAEPDNDNSRARPLFRSLAAVVAIICFILAPIYGFAVTDGRWVGIAIFFFVGIMMLTIAQTGSWPRKH